MPNKDEKLWYMVRLPRRYRARLISASKENKINIQECVGLAVDNWLNEVETAMKRPLA